jgi:N-acetylmuramoyl-L-alanine amidase
MRPYRVIDDLELQDDDPRPRVIPISSAARARSQMNERVRPSREPWTPRDDIEVEVPRRAEPAVTPARARRAAAPTTTRQFMLVTFVAVCVGMVLAMVAWRLSTGGEESAAAQNPPQASAPAQPSAPEPPPAPPPGEGAITTDVKVLQPNYSVAPGDTLGTIARRHDTTIDALAALNNLENRNSLRIGQRLIIP